MFNFWLLKNIIKYKLTSRHKYGHGIHSPFVFDFIINVLNKNEINKKFTNIENRRKELKKNNNTIEINDLGAGSKKNKNTKTKIKDIAKVSLESSKNAKLIYKISKYYNCKNALELGTSLGITSSYISYSNTITNLTTVEGCTNIANIANETFKKLNLKNINLINDNFDDLLPKLIQKNNFDLIYFDGNHKYESTIKYFNIAVEKVKNDDIFIFDDIYWSKEMTNAWKYIINDSRIKVSIDLFDLGIVFFRKELSKQNFIIRH